jgi:protein gp37
MSKSKIEWTDKVWNPVRGCAPVSEGCRNCYAARFAHRFSGPGQRYEGLTRLTEHGPKWNGQVREVPEFLEMPLRWKKPRRIFVNSMSDLFHDQVSPTFIDLVLEVMMACPQHIFQVLTKRPENLEEKLYGHVDGIVRELGGGDYVPNLWLGTSVEHQVAADKRIPELLKVPAAVRWLSLEPLLGPINLRLPTRSWGEMSNGRRGCNHCCNKDRECDDPTHHFRPQCPYCRGTAYADIINWVVVGGESGPGARPMDPDWVRSVRDQCQEAGVPFLFKQWGAYNAAGEKVGKKAAGRELDGRIWDEYPEVSGG